MSVSTLINVPARTVVATHNRLWVNDERGSQTVEYGVTILVAVALALSVFGLVTGGLFDSVITNLIKGVLGKAINLISL